jgi:hypothetical protein
MHTFARSQQNRKLLLEHTQRILRWLITVFEEMQKEPGVCGLHVCTECTPVPKKSKILSLKK